MNTCKPHKRTMYSSQKPYLVKLNRAEKIQRAVLFKVKQKYKMLCELIGIGTVFKYFNQFTSAITLIFRACPR